MNVHCKNDPLTCRCAHHQGETAKLPKRPTDEENQKLFAQSLAFNAEAVRSGMFAAAIDMLQMMKDNGVPEGEAATLTGTVEMACQFWMNAMMQAGHTPMRARKALEQQVRTFAVKHSRKPEDQQPAVAS